LERLRLSGTTMAERRIGVAMDFSPSSKKALRWSTDNLVREGDTLVLLHIRHHGKDEAKNVLWSRTGSRKLLHDDASFDSIAFRYILACDLFIHHHSFSYMAARLSLSLNRWQR
jgi:nucleotide-binding universal stress UspA family protein